jgi:hypothetical protein
LSKLSGRLKMIDRFSLAFSWREIEYGKWAYGK